MLSIYTSHDGVERGFVSQTSPRVPRTLSIFTKIPDIRLNLRPARPSQVCWRWNLNTRLCGIGSLNTNSLLIKSQRKWTEKAEDRKCRGRARKLPASDEQ